MLTIDAVIHLHATHRPDRCAILMETRSVTYRELWLRSCRVAQALRDAGLSAGDRIALLSHNHESAAELLIGASVAGMVLVPVNWRLASPEILFILKDAQASACFAEHDWLPMLREHAHALPALRLIVGLATNPCGFDYASWRDAAAIGEGASAEHNVVLQLYTSGTTGRPKGAMLTHHNLLATKPLWRNLDWYAWQDHDVGLVAMPLFHIGGMGWLLMALYAGAPALILREFDVEHILGLLDARAFTKAFFVPTALRALVRHPRAAHTDFSALRMILYGASPMPPALLRECIQRIDCGFAQQYGMTETCGTVVALAPSDHNGANAARLASAGRALPGVEIGIRDEAGNIAPPGTIGQIAIRSTANMAGYWQRPDATAQTLLPDGWLLTGDAGTIDSDGYLFVQDRLNDMIISGGENVYPTEVENSLTVHPAVAEAAVIGVPDERWGEAVIAYIVIRPDHALAAQDLRDWARAYLAAYKIPRDIYFVTELPRNASGKLLRRILREAAGPSHAHIMPERSME